MEDQAEIKVEPDENAERDSPHNREFLRYARDAYTTSNDWFDSSQRAMVEKALANFRGVHPPGSKYHTDLYSKRSKIFRPKTRSAVRRLEAALAVAFFSTEDVVHCSPLNEADEEQVLGAEAMNLLLNMRLRRPNEMRWYETLVGGGQSAATVGCVISKQYWLYHEERATFEDQFEERYFDEESGQEATRTVYEQNEETRILRDHPVIQLIAIENFRVDPACDWTDPVNTSPYTIEMQPTYVHEIEKRIEQGRYWPLRRDFLAAAIKEDWDSIRRMREGNRIDKYDATVHINEYRTVWVHHNIVRIRGQDYVYDTLGAELLLEPPRPIEEVYAHCTTGDRPYRMGFAILEAHKSYPIGIPALIEDLQEEANDIANLRLDNVKHVVNKRWFARRGRGVDLRALMRNVPGSVTLMNDPTSDVREVETRDVTSSSYEEQNRLDLDIDDIVGNFSQTSVQSNRQLSETVGGMEMVQSDASIMQEYMVRTIAETWVEPVMQQLVRMEATYETNEELLRVIAESQRADMNSVLRAIEKPLNVSVNVGFGATNPQKRIQKLALGLSTIAAFAPELLLQADRGEVVKEVFGALGYNDGSRFFPQLKSGQQDPQVVALQQQIMQLQALVQGKQQEIDGRKEIAQIQGQYRLASDKIRADVAAMKLQAEGSQKQFLALMEHKLKEYDRMLAAAKTEIEKRQLFLEREALSHQIMMDNAQLAHEQDKSMGEESRAERQENRADRSDAREDRREMREASEGAPNLPGNDKAGVISRDRYGLIPQQAG